MKDQKNIERLFQEKFKDFEATTPQGSWDIIASRLNEKKKKKRVVPFWFQLSGIAASFVIIGTLIWNFKSEEKTTPFNSNQTVVGVENNDNQNLNLNSQDNNTSNTNANNQNDSAEEKTTTSETKNSKFDSDWINSKKSSTRVVSNENKDVRSNEKNNKTNRSIISDTKKNKTGIRYNNNTKVANSTIVTNSKKTKRNKSANETLISNEDTFLLADDKNNKANNWVETKNSNNKSNQNEKINADKIDSFFDKNQTNTNFVNTINDTDKKSIDTTNVILASSESVINKDSTLVAAISPEINPLEELLKEKEAGKNEDEKEKEKRSRWAVSTNASPVYFNSVAEGSSLDNRFDANQKQYNNTLSYGIGVNYAINNKWTIKTGVNNLSLDYNTNDITFYQDMSAKPIENLTTNSMGKMISVKSKFEDNVFVSIEEFEVRKYDGAINQQISFIEVPLELGYKLLDRKFGIELIGGISTLFLNDNSVSIVSNGQEMVIGEANNLNNIHFSSNVGLGFKYSFWKSFNANFQPMFKYQINTFSENSGNFKPYFIGLYTGISFSF